MARAQRLRRRFAEEIRSATDNEKLISIILAVMVYEEFNRPWLARAVENIAFPFGKARTLGLMQVATDEWIGDRESVRRGIKKIVAAWENAKDNPNDFDSPDDSVTAAIAWDYNPDRDYGREIRTIADIIQEELYPDTEHRLTKYQPLAAC